MLGRLVFDVGELMPLISKRIVPDLLRTPAAWTAVKLSWKRRENKGNQMPGGTASQAFAFGVHLSIHPGHGAKLMPVEVGGSNNHGR